MCGATYPFSGALFAFRGRRAGLIKVLWHDGVGLCLLTKRLERGQFIWPTTTPRARSRCRRRSWRPCSRAANGGRRSGSQTGAGRVERAAMRLEDAGVDAGGIVHDRCVQIDLDALPDDPAILQQMLREVVAATTQQNAALSAENDKLRLLIQRLTRHQFGRRSEQLDCGPAPARAGGPRADHRRERGRAGRGGRGAGTSSGSGAMPGPSAITARCPRICPATRW